VGAAIPARGTRALAHLRNLPRRRERKTMPRRGGASWRSASLLVVSALLLAGRAAVAAPAGPHDLVAPADEPRRAGQAAPPARHLLAPLLGPFAERAAALQAEHAAASSKAARRKALSDALAGGRRGPRRALQQTVQTDTVLIALIILILDFFLGFYTGYIKVRQHVSTRVCIRLLTRASATHHQGFFT
jgi:hypothetical protein